MADIFLARRRDDLLERSFVLKLVRPELTDDERFERLFSSEARLAAHLRHANVVQIFDVGRAEGRLFLVMEYVEGLDLHRMLLGLSRTGVPLPARFALFVVQEVLRGLDYAHRARDVQGKPLGLVHRDISPSNVLISFEGEVKLCDFGIARALYRSGGGEEADRALAERVQVAGKLNYMSPEQARGEPIDARSDIYGVGVLLWELCAGRRMHRGAPEAILDAVRRGDVPPLPDRGLPGFEDLSRIVARALAPRPEARWGSAAEMLDALDAWSTAQGMRVSPPRFGAFLMERFGEEMLSVRRARERAAVAQEKGSRSVMTSENPEKPSVTSSSRDGVPAWIPLMLLGMVATIALMLYAGLD